MSLVNCNGTVVDHVIGPRCTVNMSCACIISADDYFGSISIRFGFQNYATNQMNLLKDKFA